MGLGREIITIRTTIIIVTVAEEMVQ